MSLNHETTLMMVIGSSGITAGGGILALIERSSSLIALGFVGTATLVTVLTFVLNAYLKLREDARQEALYRKKMGHLPDKIEGSDDA